MPQNKRNVVLISIISVLVLIISIILISVSLKKISSTQYGVEYDIWSKKLDDAAKTGGLHNGPPGFTFIKFPSTQISGDLEDTCVSRDGLRISYEVSYQYQAMAKHLSIVIIKYRDFAKWSTIVQSAASSAVQHTCSDFNITDFQNKRNLIQDNMLSNLALKLEGSTNGTFTEDGLYARAASLQLRNVHLPDAYNEAVAEKQSAEEDISLAENQRTQELTKARTQLLASHEESQKLIDAAIKDVNVTLTVAKLRADETAYAFERETEVIVQAIDNFNLDSKGVLSYLANQLYAKAPNLVATIHEPAKISMKNEL